MTGLVMTKTKTQRGLMEPVMHIRKPQSIQAEMGEEQAAKEAAACDCPGRRDGMLCVRPT